MPFVNLTSTLLDFRTKYLMGIARAWSEDPNNTSRTNGRDSINTTDQQFKYNFINPQENILKILYEDCSDILDWWLHISFEEEPTVAAEGARDPALHIEPTLVTDWVGPNDSFVMRIPQRPDHISDYAEALAAYYDLFPTIFGSGGDFPRSTTIMESRNYKLGVGEPPYYEQFPTIFSSGGNFSRSTTTLESRTYKLGIGEPEVFFAFGSLTKNIIMLAWENNRFANELINEEGACPLDRSFLLGEYFQYNNPWNFNLKFEWNKYLKWDHRLGYKRWTFLDKQGELYDGGDISYADKEEKLFNRVKLHFPQAPGAGISHPQAITTYNNTGPAYPFTCQ